jgi:hypothetical protein
MLKKCGCLRILKAYIQAT